MTQISALTIELPEKITLSNAAQSAQALREKMQNIAQYTWVVADAAVLRHFDSSAIAVLLSLRREAARLGKQFAVAQLPPKLRELISLYGVSQLLQPV